MGTCEITPEDGVPFVTSFQVTCADVVDEDTPLNYSLYVNNSSDALQTVTSPVFQPFTLESGSEADDYWVNITVIITDAFGRRLTIQLAVQVIYSTTTDVTTVDFLTTFGDIMTTNDDTFTTAADLANTVHIVTTDGDLASAIVTAEANVDANTTDVRGIPANTYVSIGDLNLTYSHLYVTHSATLAKKASYRCVIDEYKYSISPLLSPTFYSAVIGMLSVCFTHIF